MSKVGQIQKRTTDIENEIKQLEESDVCQLRIKVQETEKQGRDLLREMASQVQGDISAAKQRLSEINTTK